MADVIKQNFPINGGGLMITDLKGLCSTIKTRKTLAFAYGFMFAFVVFLTFNSHFTNIFTTSSSTGSSSYNRSQFPSIYSYFFPSDNQKPQNLATFLPPPPRNTTADVRSKNPTAQPPLGTQNSNKVPVLGPSPVVVSVKNQTQKTEDLVLSEGLKQNQPAVPVLEISSPAANRSGEDLNSSSNSSTQQNISSTVPVLGSTVKNQTQKAEDSVLSEVLKPNHTAVSAPELSPPAMKSGDSNSSSNSVNLVKESPQKSVNYSDWKKQNHHATLQSIEESLMNCDFFDGNWVKDESYPLYKPGSCSFIDEQFNCINNGRPDADYHKFKWKPKACTLPRLNGGHLLGMLKGKRLVFVGDSLNRNMWESLVCILKNSVKDQSKVYEAQGLHHFRGEASYSFIFKDYNCTVEFFVSPFLVQEWEMPDKDGTKKETLRLDLVGRSSDQYKNADIIIFNTGHWWTHDKTSKGKDYYQEGSHVYGELNVLEAFRKALTTWARWVDANVNPKKSWVFFRGYSASHFSGGQWNSGGACDNETEPIDNDKYLTPYPPKMLVLEKVFKGMKTNISYLNVTRITDYRKDGHPSIYRKKHISEVERKSPMLYQDCSHWCLPGVPDAWNEILYAELLVKQYQKKQRGREIKQ